MTATTDSPYTGTRSLGEVVGTTYKGSNGGALPLAITETDPSGTAPREIGLEDVEFVPDGSWAARCPRCGHHEVLVATGFNPDSLIANRELRRLRAEMARLADTYRRAALLRKDCEA